jgi:hypothetical protein
MDKMASEVLESQNSNDRQIKDGSDGGLPLGVLALGTAEDKRKVMTMHSMTAAETVSMTAAEPGMIEGCDDGASVPTIVG